MADEEDNSIKTKQVISDIVTSRTDQNVPPVPWYTVSEADDDNPFLGFAIETTWAKWSNTPFQELINNMYARKHGTGPGKTHKLKSPDIAYNKPRDLFKEHLSNPLNLRHFERANNSTNNITPGESQPSIPELSKMLSSLVGNPANEEYMKGRDQGRGSRVQNQRAVDRHNTDEARKLGVCLVASQLLLCDQNILRSIPITFNMPGSKNSQSDYDEEKLEYAPVHYGVYLQFNDGTTTILPVSIDLLGYRKRPFVSRPWNSQIMGTPDKVLSPWYMSWDKDIGAGSLLNVFKDFPLLVVNDAKLVLPPAYGSTEYVKGHSQARQTWDDDMTVYPPRVMAATWGLHTALGPETRLYPLSLGCARRPLLANKTFRWRVDHIPKGLLRFTNLKMLVAEVRGYGITVEIPGKVYPMHMVDLDKIKIHRPVFP